jgi:mannitol/fructose-specific phosphotransferase system IIA component (Ntr-type)
MQMMLWIKLSKEASMGLEQHLCKENFFALAPATDKTSAITHLVGHAQLSIPLDAPAVIKHLLSREVKRSSGCGKNIAIVHMLDRSIPNISVTVGTFKGLVPWDAVDGKGVRVAALVLSPPRHLRSYMSLVAEVCKVLADDATRASLTVMTTPAQMMTVLYAARMILA